MAIDRGERVSGSITGSLADRVVLITGSSRGIGAEIAAKAGAEGAVVAIHYRESRDGADRTLARVREAGGSGDCFSADLGDGTQAERLVSDVIGRFGRIDGLVNNAGMDQRGPTLEMSPGEWDQVIATNLTACFRTIHAAIPTMLEQGSGSIVNIASRLGQMGIAETAAYSAAKAGLIGLTRSLAREFGTKGVRINAVAPGVTLTEMTTDLVDSEAGKARLRDMALGRFGRADEVAEAVIFLLSDRASLFTGQTLNPNSGGYMP
jgi:3-oxoacyl-[acyl-carrier protein] reductase